MIQKISNSMFLGNGPIKMLYPGQSVSRTDTGIGSIGRIDHPEFHGNTIIQMHPHINDEILSYFRTGKAEHSDSEGIVRMIGGNTLMLMKAGSSFYHEEKIFGTNEPFEGLQIFIRPGKKDLKPEVIFHELDSLHRDNNWRALASPDTDTPFQFSSQTWLFDIKLQSDTSTQLPKLPKEDLTCILYVFKGQIEVNKTIGLQKKDSLLIKNEDLTIKAIDQDAELVLFVTDETAEAYSGGMYSGNKV